MPVEKIAEKVPAWLERVLLPSLNEIRGEIKAVNTRIDSLDEKMDIKITALDEKIDSLRNETKTEISSLNIKISSVDERITSLRNETKSEFTGLNYRLDSIENRIPVIEKITALEIKIAELEKRLAAA